MTPPSTSSVFHAAKISRAIWRLSCPAMVASFGSPDSGQSLSLGLRLLQPEPHVHLAVHRRHGGEVFVPGADFDQRVGRCVTARVLPLQLHLPLPTTKAAHLPLSLSSSYGTEPAMLVMSPIADSATRGP